MSDQRGQAHRRHQVLAAVLADVTCTGRPVISRLDEVHAAFGDVDGFLRAAQQRWYTAFIAHLDAVLETPPDDLAQGLAQLWADLAVRHGPLRALLDEHAECAAVAEIDERYRRLLRRDIGVDLAALPELRVERGRCPLLTRWRQVYQRQAQHRLAEVA